MNKRLAISFTIQFVWPTLSAEMDSELGSFAELNNEKHFGQPNSHENSVIIHKHEDLLKPKTQVIL